MSYDSAKYDSASTLAIVYEAREGEAESWGKDAQTISWDIPLTPVRLLPFAYFALLSAGILYFRQAFPQAPILYELSMATFRAAAFAILHPIRVHPCSSVVSIFQRNRSGLEGLSGGSKPRIDTDGHGWEESEVQMKQTFAPPAFASIGVHSRLSVRVAALPLRVFRGSSSASQQIFWIGAWTTLSGTVTATGPTAAIEDPTASASERFYRLLVMP